MTNLIARDERKEIGVICIEQGVSLSARPSDEPDTEGITITI